MSADELDITPETKVGALLDTYPRLESVLVALAPAFSKLRNPVLRRTVAKVTTLRQASKVGNVSIGTLINELRKAVGQEAAVYDSGEEGVPEAPPDWLEDELITDRLDARPMIASGERPVSVVMSRLMELDDGEIFELTAPFVPAPLIDMARQKGLTTWHHTERPEVVKTYFIKLTGA